MQNEELVKEWIQLAEMDYQTSIHLDKEMHPKPMEIICFHCQQAVEKMLKGVLMGYGVKIQRTHDLGLLAEQLQKFVHVSEEQIEMCDDLTPYGVKIRYPQELYIEEHHVAKALENTKKLYDWLRELTL